MATNDSSDAAETGIAIVGMGLRVPGARTANEYWQNIAAGVESVRQLTDEELIAHGEDPERLKHPRYVKSASILQDMDTFDPEFFGLSPKEAGIMDPQHRQLLETAWEALEDACHTPEKFDGPIGVWAGCGMGAYFANNILTNRELVEQVGLFLLRHTGNDKDFLPTRVSYCLNLRGPSVGVQTACSTSLVAVHYACQALLNRECDMALAGGVTIEIPHGRGYLYEEGEILSPDGRCRAFDHRSAGTIFGSGAGIVVLRRLEDALADGDQIYAVIKGSAVNNDGSGKVGYLAPSVEGQAAAVAEALAVADISAATIGYVEAHGTGTAVGDPIEIAALTEAFRETTDRKGYCGIGSVKTNIGHLDTAAGVASLIKATLALKHRKLPPSLNFERPNPHIDFASTPFFVNHALRDFPAPTPGGRRRATVNSLGVGGTNAHVVLEEAPPRAAVAAADTPAPELLLLSARSKSSLDGSSKKLASFLRESTGVSLRDVAHTLATGRAQFSERRVLVARDREHAIAQLDALDPRKVFTHSAASGASVVFMFPGGGAQYPNMGRRLYETEPVFKEHIDRGLGLLAKRVAYDPRALLFPEPAERAKAAAELERPSYQLPLIFIVEFALAKLWQSLGVTPAALIGHSVGENTAAAIAGVFAYEDALDLILLRGRLMDEVPEGAMMSVPLSASELTPLLGEELDLACVNAPELCVASGPRPRILALQRQLAERDVECQLIRINIAAHSRMLDGALERFGAFLRKIRLSAPTIPVISNRTGKRLLPEEARAPEYWVEHLRSTVLFGEGVGTLLEQPGRVFLEVGPGRALSSLARQHPAVAQGQAFIGSLPHVDDDTPDHEIFLAAFGRLWGAGVDVDLQKARKSSGQRISLPTYAFQKQRYWIEQKAPTAVQASAPYPKRLDSERWYFAPTWRAHYPDVDPDTAPHTWLVFVDETGLGESVAERLRDAGDEVVTVRLGDNFMKVSDLEYRLAPEHGTEGYESLIREVLQSGKPPDRIAHFWLLSDGETFRPGSSFFHRNQELGFYSLLFLAQALSAAELPVRLHISVITRGMQKVGSARLRYPDQATVLGPIKVIPRELEGVTCTSIDLEPSDRPEGPAKPRGNLLRRLLDAGKPAATSDGGGATPAATGADELDALLSELRMPPANGEISLSGDARWVRRYEPIPAPRAERPRLRKGGVYLVTGGLGGIGLTIAKNLAEAERAKLALVNRTPLPPREEWDDWLERRPAEAESARIRTVRQLEALGAEVLVASGDVADLDRMSEVIEETKTRFGALHGVIHAAGVLEDAPLGAKRQASIEAVFGPKVYGTLVLDRVLAREPLDFFVVFSSTSTAIAAAGQVDYVGANAFLDAFAEKARADGRNVLSLAWGVWAEVGLAASAADKLGGDATQGRGAPCTYPLFTGKWLSQGSALLRGTLDPGALWILDEHRTENRQAVMPGTGYLELARAALREVGHDGPFAIEDLYFLRALDVPDAGGLEFRIRLKSSDEGFSFELQSKRRLSDGREGYVLHAQAFLRRFLPVAPSALDLTQLDQRCRAQRTGPLAEGHKVKQERHLLFGPRWRNLRRYAIGEGEAFAELNLRETFVPDLGVFGLHPGMLDIATGFAIELEPSYGEGDKLWVPVSYDRVSVYGDLTPTLYSHVQLRSRSGGSNTGGFARFDITLTDDKGNVLVDIDGFAMQALASTSFEIVEPRAQELEQEGPRRELAAAERALLHNLSEGITPKEGVDAFRRLVDTMSSPRARVMVSSMDVRQLVKQADLMVPASKEDSGAVTFERPALSSEYVAPRSEVEKTLAAMWENLLGVSQVGVLDNFFELGGHSLVAVRLFARMKKTFGVDYPISVLIERPTIEGCAALVAPNESAAATVSVETPRAEKREARYKHLVPMNPPAGDKRGRLPFFLVAGMFGNVMNLRHLASLVGEERPFHGVQARGLLGSEAPHETFEESARDYLAEIRAVQPHGPYLLGGFSGGGITAYEMARQLAAEGEEVPLIVMLDTPIPHDEPLTLREKLSIHQQNFQRDGAQYVMRWAEHKIAHKKAMQARAAQAADQEKSQDAGFRSQVIEAAFYRAIERYQLVPSSFHIALFRPRLKAAFKFGPGRAINVDRRRIYYDNGWAPYAQKVDVFETPGDHDSMVLEPNVRILAARLRECLDQAEALAAAKQPKSAGPDKAAPPLEASL